MVAWVFLCTDVIHPKNLNWLVVYVVPSWNLVPNVVMNASILEVGAASNRSSMTFATSSSNLPVSSRLAKSCPTHGMRSKRASLSTQSSVTQSHCQFASAIP